MSIHAKYDAAGRVNGSRDGIESEEQRCSIFPLESEGAVAEEQALNKPNSSTPSGSRQLQRFAVKVVIVNLVTIAFCFLLVLAWYMADFILLSFAGVLMTLVVRSASVPLKRIARLPDSLSVLVVILAGAVGLYLLLSSIAPQVAVQTGELKRKLPDAVVRLTDQIASHPFGQRLLEEAPNVREWVKKRGIAREVTRFFSATFGIVTNTFIFLFIGFYFSFNPGIYLNGFLRLVPPGKRSRAAEVLDTIGTMLRRWLIGRLIGMTAIGAMIGSGLWILGVPLALSLGLLTMLLDFIPFIGPVAAALPAVLLALLESPATALSVIALFVVVQHIENYIIIPLIEKNRVFLPPAVIIFAQVLLGFTGGILGLAIATPLAAVVVTLVKMLYIEDLLGERVEEAGKRT